jgi:hypothetical protein
MLKTDWIFAIAPKKAPVIIFMPVFCFRPFAQNIPEMMDWNKVFTPT